MSSSKKLEYSEEEVQIISNASSPEEAYQLIQEHIKTLDTTITRTFNAVRQKYFTIRKEVKKEKEAQLVKITIEFGEKKVAISNVTKDQHLTVGDMVIELF